MSLMKKPLCLAGLLVGVLACAGMAGAVGPNDVIESLGSTGGVVEIKFHRDALNGIGVDAAVDPTSLKIDASASSLTLGMTNGNPETMSGMLMTEGQIRLRINGEIRTLSAIGFAFEGNRVKAVDSGDVHGDVFVADPRTATVRYDAASQSFTYEASILLAGHAEEQFGLHQDVTGVTIGTLRVQSALGTIDLDAPVSPANLGGPEAGADVIVGGLVFDSTNWGYGVSGGIAAYSIGTTSCNLGTVPLNWIDTIGPNQTEHPVIGQNMYRWMVVSGSGRFEQIGQSWLKHGFCALQQTLCAACTPSCGGCCDFLGVGCSDPYNSTRNGQRSGLGPKSQINPSAGTMSTFPPPHPPNTPSATSGRCQVLVTDIDAAMNPGARWFGEGQYVAHDDATAGNKNNNASYREVAYGAAPNYLAFWPAGSATVRQSPAIHAWGIDPDGAGALTSCESGVTYVNVDVPSDGRMILAYKVTALGGGQHHYEYALFNLNSHRAARSFVVPIPMGVNVTNIGFHDVPYHSGDGNVIGTNYDGTDWPGTLGGGNLSWSTADEATAPNGNALRWATLYNFRFDANQPATTGSITIDLYRAGAPANMVVTAAVPQAVPCSPPSIDPMNVESTACGLPWSSAVPVVSSGTPPYTWTIQSGGPVGMTIDAGTGQLSWPNPVADPASYDVTIQAASQCGAFTDTVMLSLAVVPGDFNGDGAVDSADVPYFVDHLLGVSSSQNCAADQDNSTIVDGEDIDDYLRRLIP